MLIILILLRSPSPCIPLERGYTPDWQTTLFSAVDFFHLFSPRHQRACDYLKKLGSTCFALFKKGDY